MRNVLLPHRLGCNSLQPLLLTPCPAHRVQHQCTVKKINDNSHESDVYLNVLRPQTKDLLEPVKTEKEIDNYMSERKAKARHTARGK